MLNIIYEPKFNFIMKKYYDLKTFSLITGSINVTLG